MTLERAIAKCISLCAPLFWLSPKGLGVTGKAGRGWGCSWESLALGLTFL